MLQLSFSPLVPWPRCESSQCCGQACAGKLSPEFCSSAVQRFKKNQKHFQWNISSTAPWLVSIKVLHLNLSFHVSLPWSQLHLQFMLLQITLLTILGQQIPGGCLTRGPRWQCIPRSALSPGCPPYIHTYPAWNDVSKYKYFLPDGLSEKPEVGTSVGVPGFKIKTSKLQDKIDMLWEKSTCSSGGQVCWYSKGLAPHPRCSTVCRRCLWRFSSPSCQGR